MTRNTLLLAICIFMSGCFMDSKVPLGPVSEASFDTSLLDSWVVEQNDNGEIIISSNDGQQLEVIMRETVKGQQNDDVMTGHITELDGKKYFNSKSSKEGRYNLYKLERPCNDVILLMIPRPDILEADIKSGKVKGEVKQDFFTFRYVDEDQQGLRKYIAQNGERLFEPFWYMKRKSKKDSLSEECRARIKPLQDRK